MLGQAASAGSPFKTTSAGRATTVASHLTQSLARKEVSSVTTPAAAAMAPVALPTINRVPHSSLHVSKPTWWLESRFHFSFADYWNPKRESFGSLRVVNDDLVKPRAGFGTHPHRDAEIFSYVVDGELSHADSMGNKEALPRGCVQYMSAGTGVTHSEMNDGDATCRFIQVWLSPDQRGHQPQYGSSRYTHAERHNRLLHMLGGSGAAPPPAWPGVHAPHAIKLHQDANVYVSESDPGVSFALQLGPQRQAYVVVIEGSLRANDVELGTRDGAGIVGDGSQATGLTLAAGDKGAHFLLLEMAKPGF